MYRKPKYTTDCQLYIIYIREDQGRRIFETRIEKIKEVVRTTRSTVGIGYVTESGRFVLEENINKQWEFDNRERAYKEIRWKLYDIENV